MTPGVLYPGRGSESLPQGRPCGSFRIAVSSLFRDQVLPLDVLEVTVGGYAQLLGGRIVAHEDAVGMHLQRRDGPLMVVRAFDAVAHRAGFLVPRGEDQHLLGRQHRAHADRQRGLRYEGRVAAEETGVDLDRVLRQGLDARARVERREGLVEGDVAVLADAAHEEVDAPGLDDAGLVVGALLRQVVGVAVEDVDVLGLDVDVLEEVVPHERMVAFGMLLGKSHVLVHVERDDIPERHLAGLVAADQLLVGFQRGRTRRAGPVRTATWSPAPWP